MKILALDLGNKTGWATHDDGGRINSGTESFGNGPYDGAGICYLRFQQWIREKHAGQDLVILEGVQAHLANAVYSQHKYGGYLAILCSECEQLNIPYTAEGVTTIKKFWTGKGNAKKDAMIKEAQKRGFNPCDDNEADALALLHMAIDTFDKLL